MSEMVGSLQQRLEGSQAEHFVQHLLDDAVLLHQAERRLLFFNEPRDSGPDLGARPFTRHGRKRFQIDPVQQLAVQRKLQFLVLRRVTFITEQAIYPARLTAARSLNCVC